LTMRRIPDTGMACMAGFHGNWSRTYRVSGSLASTLSLVSRFATIFLTPQHNGILDHPARDGPLATIGITLFKPNTSSVGRTCTRVKVNLDGPADKRVMCRG